VRVQDLMTGEVLTVGRDAALKEAARRMIEAGVSGLVVTDASGNIEGVITEADFVKAESGRRAAKRARLLRWFSHEEDPLSAERRVEDVMTADVITLGPQADHAEAARVMRKSDIKRIPIVDDDGRLIGIVSRSDILRAFVRPDADIIAEIKNQLMAHVLWIDPKRVKVGSADGNVTISGRLETKSDAVLLAEMIGRLDGVVSIRSDLTWDVDNTKMEMVPPPPGPGARQNR